MSRKVWPLGLDQRLARHAHACLRPPLSLSTTAVSTIAVRLQALVERGEVLDGSMSLSGSIPEAPSRSCS
jgi:hypothetical protein